MPTYDYECRGCGETTEIFQRISEAPKRKCPHCGKPRLKRLIGSGGGLIFRGSGFYITDYRSSEYQAKAKADANAGKGSGDGEKPKSPDSSKKKSPASETSKKPGDSKAAAS